MANSEESFFNESEIFFYHFSNFLKGGEEAEKFWHKITSLIS